MSTTTRHARPAARSAKRETPKAPARRARPEEERQPRGRRRSGGGGGGASPAARPVWSGSISFGLVNIPVRLFSASREQRVNFHQLHDQDKVRLRRKLVSGSTGKDVHPEHVVKGYGVGDEFVIVHQDELEACAPEKTRAIEITDFVNVADIDPIYLERTYYVLPQQGAARSYRLLVEAMNRSGRVGIARVVMHDKEHLCSLRPHGGVLALSTMYFDDEVIPPDAVEGVGDGPPHVGEKDAKAARALVESKSAKFDPTKFHDRYRECLMKFIEKKAQAEKVVVSPRVGADEDEGGEQKRPAARGDLMAALEASLASARSQAKRRKSA
jgi:DNA end-binding protein Ku